MTITTLLQTLAKIANDGPLPRTLLLQMDNCVRENKNKYVFGFLALLVEIGIIIYRGMHNNNYYSATVFQCSSVFLAVDIVLSLTDTRMLSSISEAVHVIK